MRVQQSSCQEKIIKSNVSDLYGKHYWKYIVSMLLFFNLHNASINFMLCLLCKL